MQTFIYAVTLHRKHVRPLGPPPIALLLAQVRRLSSLRLVRRRPIPICGTWCSVLRLVRGERAALGEPALAAEALVDLAPADELAVEPNAGAARAGKRSL